MRIMQDEKPNQQSSLVPAYLPGSRKDDMSTTRRSSLALYVLVRVGILIFNMVDISSSTVGSLRKKY